MLGRRKEYEKLRLTCSLSMDMCLQGLFVPLIFTNGKPSTFELEREDDLLDKEKCPKTLICEVRQAKNDCQNQER